MEKDTAETIVKVYAILAWISALFTFFGALALLFVSSFMTGFAGGMMGWGMMDQAFAGSMFGGFSIIFGVILLAIAVFDVIVGFGLWGRKNWARVVTVVFSVFSLFSFPLGTIVGALGIYFFGFDETVKGLFSGDVSIAAMKSSAKQARKTAKKVVKR